MKTIQRVLIAGTIVYCAHPLPCFAQGSLTPPAAPTPTMKSLDQIEARTPIDAAHTTSDSSNQFIITQPGSYYLTGNITGVADKTGISIQSNDVTVDLMGFEMVGAATSQRAIYAPTTVNNICIRNGTFRGWGAVGAVVSLTNANNSIVKDLRVADSSSFAAGGIFVGIGCVVTDCVVSNVSPTGASFGISLGSSSTAVRCAVQSCNIGIETNTFGAVIRDCVVRQNRSAGMQAAGSVISHCVAYSNNGDGIFVTGSCLVADCNASYNAMSHTAGTAGIHIMNDHNRVEGNVVSYNGYDGIFATTNNAINNMIVRNHSGANAQFQYRIPGINNTDQCCVGDNAIGPILGNTDVNTATNPFANLQD